MRICNPHDQQNTTSKNLYSFYYQTQGRHSIKKNIHTAFSRENNVEDKEFFSTVFIH